MQKENYSKQVANRIMEVYRIASIKELVAFLGANEGTFRSWLSRDSIDIRLIIAKCNDGNLNYILTGEQQQKVASNLAPNLAPKIAPKTKPSSEEGSDPEIQLILSKQMCQIHLKRIEELSADNAILKKENAELKAENAQLKGENTSSNKQSRSAS